MSAKSSGLSESIGRIAELTRGFEGGIEAIPNGELAEEDDRKSEMI